MAESLSPRPKRALGEALSGGVCDCGGATSQQEASVMREKLDGPMSASVSMLKHFDGPDRAKKICLLLLFAEAFGCIEAIRNQYTRAVLSEWGVSNTAEMEEAGKHRFRAQTASTGRTPVREAAGKTCLTARGV